MVMAHDSSLTTLIMYRPLLISLTFTLTLTSLTLGIEATNCTYVSVSGSVVSADCSDRGWTQVPGDLPASLESLDLSGNLLVSLPACAFCHLPLLQSLDLNQNNIQHLVNSSFSGLGRLRWLGLRQNGLRMVPGKYPGEVFKNLTRLTFLDLQHNQPPDWSSSLSYPDTALSALTGLKTLRMDGLANNVDLGPGFSGLSTLELLDLNGFTGNCPTDSLSATFFSHINTSRPLTVNLSSCELRFIHAEAFSRLPTLYSLDLFSNRPLNFPPFMEGSRGLVLTDIKVLNISYIHRYTNIKVRAEYFQHLAFTSLEVLVVNNVEAYDFELGAMFNLPTTLRYLSLYDNKLINATFMLGLYLLPHLDTLQVSRQNHFNLMQDTVHSNHSGHRPSQQGVERTSVLPAENVTEDQQESPMLLRGSKSNKSAVLKFVTRDHPTARDITRKSVFSSLFNQAGKSHPDTRVSFNTTPSRIENSLLVLNERNTTDHPSLDENIEVTATKVNTRLLSGGASPTPFASAERGSVYGTPLNTDEGVSMKEKASTQAGAAAPLYDPSICLDPGFQRKSVSHLLQFLQTLTSFLHDRNMTQGREAYIPERSLNSRPRNRTSLLDVLLRGHTSSSGSDQGHTVLLPPTVRNAYGSELKLGYVLPQMHFLANSLEVVDVSKNNMPCFLGPFSGLDKLRSFDLSNNFAVYLSKDFFGSFPSLTHLYLQGNFLGQSLANDSHGETLGGLGSLQVLNLDGNSIKQLSADIFRAQVNMTHLSLARNAIRTFLPRVGHMTSLTLLDLSGNSLAYLPKDLLHDLDSISQSSNLTVSLHQNPLSCDCDTLDFWYWVVESGTRVHLHLLEEYVCTLGNGSEVGYEVLSRELDSVWLHCQGQTFLSVAIGMLVTLLFLLSVLGVLHYKRWRLRYFYYVGLRHYRRPYHDHPYITHPANNTIRDVFISFDDDDRHARLFVQDVLIPEFDRRGLTYYISEVEFAGRPIRDIIPDAVLGARKTLALLSAHFFPSYERELEFNMAVYHEEEIHQRVIVPVLLGPVEWSVFPQEVLVYLEEHFCLPYQPGSATFMDSLVNLIRADARI